MGSDSQHYLAARPTHYHQIPTPSSAVSSFNLPASCDSTLVTPITTDSPTNHIKPTSAAIMKKNTDFRLSPTIASPTYLMNEDDDFSRYTPPMRWREGYGVSVSTSDVGFPTSPLCPSPYTGHFTVSATPHSAGTSHSSSSLQHSPHVLSAGGLSGFSTDSQSSRGMTPALSAAGYRPSQQPPILIAPNPSTFRSGGGHHSPRQNNLMHVDASPPGSRGSRQGSYSPLSGTANSGVKKSVKNKREHHAAHICMLTEHRRGNLILVQEDLFLLELKINERDSWKEIARKFNSRFNKDMKEATLQMRLTRLRQKFEDQNPERVGERNGKNRRRRVSADSYDAATQQYVTNDHFSLLSEHEIRDQDLLSLLLFQEDTQSWSDSSSSSSSSSPNHHQQHQQHNHGLPPYPESHQLPHPHQHPPFSVVSPQALDSRNRAASDTNLRYVSQHFEPLRTNFEQQQAQQRPPPPPHGYQHQDYGWQGHHGLNTSTG